MNKSTQLSKTIDPGIPRGMMLAVWALAMLMASTRCWMARFTMNPDGICYLDIADAYRHADWSAAVNAYWSPLYSWLLAVALTVVNPDGMWESSVVRVVNLVIFAGSMACFHYFIVQLVAHNARCGSSNESPEGNRSNMRAYYLLGYALFLWSSFSLIGVELVSPDLCVLGLVSLATALLLKILSGSGGIKTHCATGIVLGLAYLAKTAMFPIGIIYLFVIVLTARRRTRGVRLAVSAAVVFLLVVTPFFAAVSAHEGKVTIGESGRLNYARMVHGARLHVPASRATDLTSAVPRRIFDGLGVFEFQGPSAGTYPLAFDPAYWRRATNAQFLIRPQMSATAHSLNDFARRLPPQSILLAGWLTLFLLRRQDRQYQWPNPGALLWVLPSLLGIGMYALVVIEPRYVAGFVAMGWMAAFCLLIGGKNHSEHPALTAAPAGSALTLILWITVFGTLDSMSIGRKYARHDHWRVAEHLVVKGVAPGDRVAVIGDSFRAYWARLAEVQIGSELFRTDVDQYWHSQPDIRKAVVESLRKTGARAIIANPMPLSEPDLGWVPLGDTGYYVFPFTPLP